MKVLCIFDHLPVPGQNHRKEGVYPTFVKIHTDNKIDTTVATLDISNNFNERQELCLSYGAKYITPKSMPLSKLSKFFFIVFKDTSFFHLSGIHTHWIKFIFANRNLLGGIDEYFNIHGKPNIVSGMTSIEGSGRIAFLISKCYGIPFTTRENRTTYTRGLIDGPSKIFRRDIVKSASTVFPVSPTLGENMQQVLDLDIPNIVPLQNPVAERFFQKRQGKAEWISNFSCGRFTFAGWTNWRDIKRLDIALKAFKETQTEYPDICLIIAGPVPDWAESLIESLNLSGAVWLAGSLGRREIYDLAHSCDCCLVPSDHDPGNNSVIEAMAAGKPVIVTECGGSESRIVSKNLGRITPKNNIDKFSLAMKEVIKQKESFDPEYISSHAYEFYSEKVFSQVLIRSYNNIQKKLSS